MPMNREEITRFVRNHIRDFINNANGWPPPRRQDREDLVQHIVKSWLKDQNDTRTACIENYFGSK